jgi:hypothetical protein
MTKEHSMTKEQTMTTRSENGIARVAGRVGVLTLACTIATTFAIGAPLSAGARDAVSAAQAQTLGITFKSAPVKVGAKDAPVMGATPVLAVGDNALEVTVKDAMGMAIADADVSVVFSMAAMPAMSMPAMRNEVKLKAAGAGVYRATAPVAMGGKWGVTVLVKQAGKDAGKRELSVVAK